MQLHVVAVGRIRDTGIRAACDEYVRRASRRLSIREHEVADAGRRGGAVAETLRLEGEQLERAVPARAARVALTRTGEQLDSRAFADRVRRWQEGARDVAVLLGGAHGLAPTLREACTEQLSLSPLTLPHDLARLILFEQLYRAVTLLDGHPYHKGA